MQIERRVLSTSGELMVERDGVAVRSIDGADVDSYVNSLGAPPEFRAKIKLMLAGREDLARIEFDERDRQFRSQAAERLTRAAAEL